MGKRIRCRIAVVMEATCYAKEKKRSLRVWLLLDFSKTIISSPIRFTPIYKYKYKSIYLHINVDLAFFSFLTSPGIFSFLDLHRLLASAYPRTEIIIHKSKKNKRSKTNKQTKKRIRGYLSFVRHAAERKHEKKECSLDQGRRESERRLYIYNYI